MGVPIQRVRLKTAFLWILFAGLNCLAFALILYLYLQTQQATNSSRTPSNYKLEWDPEVSHNFITPQVISSNVISLNGWWISQEKWTLDIECPGKNWGICVKVFSIQCHPKKVQSIFQYVPFHHNISITDLKFGLRVKAEGIINKETDAIFGGYVLFKLLDGSTRISKLNFKYQSSSYTHQHLKFALEKPLASVLVMLTCYGLEGRVTFADVKLLSIPSISRSTAVSACPATLTKPEKIVSEYSTDVVMIISEKYIKAEAVSLVIAVSMDRLQTLVKCLGQYDGPSSVAIFLPHNQQDDDWERVYIQKKLKEFEGSITVTIVTGSNKTFPINLLRNVAIRNAVTEFIFMLDGDFLPSPDFQMHFLNIYKFAKINSNNKDQIAWVVPAFECTDHVNIADISMPKTKDEVYQQAVSDDSSLQPFYFDGSPESHRVTDYHHWYTSAEPYKIYTYSDMYEPYIILRKTLTMPYYDERFNGYGMNKVTHVTHLFAAGYDFWVLPHNWVIHFSHKASSHKIEFMQSPEDRLRNRQTRFEFIEDLMRMYKIESCSNI